jgi:hypothetical protein
MALHDVMFQKKEFITSTNNIICDNSENLRGLPNLSPSLKYYR